MFGEVDDYKLYYAQSLFKAGEYIAAQKIAATMDQPHMASKVAYF